MFHDHELCLLLLPRVARFILSHFVVYFFVLPNYSIVFGSRNTVLTNSPESDNIDKLVNGLTGRDKLTNCGLKAEGLVDFVRQLRSTVSNSRRCVSRSRRELTIELLQMG